MFKYEKLYENVFDNNVEADELVIITGYIGPSIIEDLRELPYKTSIFVGMYGNNVNEKIHNSLLAAEFDGEIEIYYTKRLIHSKCYVWYKDNSIVKVLMGSANFSMNGLKTPYRETLSIVLEDGYNSVGNYVKFIKDNSYRISLYTGDLTGDAFNDEFTRNIALNEVEISFLASKSSSSKNIIGESTNTGDVNKSSGLNWGFATTSPSSPNDAYIKIPASIIRENNILFPTKDNRYEYIDTIWDDGTKMQMLLEGNQDIDDEQYAKQISSYKNKSELGIYLRKRIGEKLGVDLIIPVSKDELRSNPELYRDKMITKEMLELYGRNNIGIKLIGENTYYFDFSCTMEVNENE